jgi:anaerobic magnesium-protoporphyrin IX monomethyl ester cyclase
MRRHSAVLIGFQDQGNLGLGYLASTLAERGFVAQTIDFRRGRESILEAVRETKPLLVGFSLIFQYFLPQFAQLASYLRDNGVDRHFCVGGHFPSLRYDEVLRTVPELDSVARCEGEVTLGELMECLAQGTDWHAVTGIAYRAGAECVATPPRALIADLDALPFPARPAGDQAILGKKAAPLLASRGCARNCSFCSIRQFYRLTPGKKVRVRSPEKVAEEMRVLHEERRISVFLFQDDDFPIWGAFGRRWVEQFIQALHAKGLAGRIIWKISCRADEVEAELFTRMREAGLYMVYLGLESGNATGLRTLNKGLVVEDSLRAVATLKEIGLLVGYGFMLFDPSSTFESIRANVSFLRQVTGDGTTAALFCRMLPYAGTPIETRLAEEGRLHGTVVDPDYDFLDARMGEFFDALNEVTAGWIHGPNALANQLNWAWQEYWVMRRLFPALTGLDGYERCLRAIARRSNEYLLRLVEEVAAVFDRGEGEVPSLRDVRADSQGFADQLLSKRNAFVLRNQQRMFAALEAAA